MQNLLNAALLGSKQPPEDFYTQSILAHAQAIAGKLPTTLAAHHHWQAIAPMPSQPTSERTCPPAASHIIHTWLNQKRRYLVQYALDTLMQHGYTLPSEVLSEVFMNWRDVVPTELLGVQGNWLRDQLPSHQHSEPQEAEETDWSLLPHAQRKAHLAQQRQIDPDMMREQLKEIWSSAPATQRQEYLELLADNLSDNDMDFLNAALKDRSKNVKEIAQKLLFRLPASEIAQQYLGWLKEKLAFHSGKWHTIDTPYTKEMKAAGIDEISPNKRESDANYQLRQIVQKITLPMWATFLDVDETQAAKILVNHHPCKFLERGAWAYYVNDVRFTYEMIDHAVATASGKVFVNKKHIPSDIVHLWNQLPVDLREQFIAKHGSHLHTNHFPFDYLGDDKQPPSQWGLLYSMFVLRSVLRLEHIYHLNSYADYERLAVSLHIHPDTIDAISQIPQIMEREQFPTWRLEHYEVLLNCFMQKVKFLKLFDFQAA